jgi:hypothetical protein
MNTITRSTSITQVRVARDLHHNAGTSLLVQAFLATYLRPKESM